MELAYQIIILSLILFGYFFFLIPNLLALRNKSDGLRVPDIEPLISVLIPARDEAKRIERTIRSLLQTTYPNVEILVLDDNSTDHTADIVRLLAEEDSRIRLFQGKPLESGWMGKNYACHQLAQQARGDYLFFTDADIEASPELLKITLTHSLSQKADLVTGLPRLWSRSFWGKVVVPNAHFMLLGYLPIPLANSDRFPKVTFGTGAFLFFKKDAYWKIGGHEAVGQLTGEDVALAQRVKQFHLKLYFIDPSPYLSSEMYESLREVWDGYGKSIYTAFASAPVYFFVFILTVFLLYLFPFYFLIHDWIVKPGTLAFYLVALQVLLGYSYRLIAAYRFRLSWESVVFHPLSCALMILIGIHSAWIHLRKIGYEWKGRVYN